MDAQLILGLDLHASHLPLKTLHSKLQAIKGWARHDLGLGELVHHTFFNDTRPAYDPEAAAVAWQRTLAWFDRYLKN